MQVDIREHYISNCKITTQLYYVLWPVNKKKYFYRMKIIFIQDSDNSQYEI